jgi:hypothetical protein
VGPPMGGLDGRPPIGGPDGRVDGRPHMGGPRWADTARAGV